MIVENSLEVGKRNVYKKYSTLGISERVPRSPTCQLLTRIPLSLKHQHELDLKQPPGFT